MVNWKVKYTLTVNYPGNQQDHVQLAWEADADRPAPCLISGAKAVGLPVTNAVTTGREVENVYVKVQWAQRLNDWHIVLYLAFVLPPETTPDAFRETVSSINRPRGAADVPGWLGRLGATAADWRIEVELEPPHTPETIAKGLFLHHLIRQVNTTQNACLSRPQFVHLFHRDIVSSDAAVGYRGAELLACNMLRTFCTENGIPVHRTTGYPMQPRPHDLIPIHCKNLANDCFVTPKVDGLEAFLVVHRHGVVIILRDGTTRIRPCDVERSRVPIILEGELLGNEVFMAYDCLTTPVVNYVNYGRYVSRYVAMCNIIRWLIRLNCPCSFKPIFHVDEAPHMAIHQCMKWAQAQRVPCDGVVFVANTQVYASARRLWKVKYTPTIDFLLQHAYADVFELMLRSSGTLVQSLHRFSDGVTEYTLPVLVRPPDGASLTTGDVVEVSVHVQRPSLDASVASVDFPTMHIRERGKQANCLLGGMDLTARGARPFPGYGRGLISMSVHALVQPDCPHLLRSILSGPVRRARNSFLQGVLTRTQPSWILEIGGGCGGDAAQWASHTSVLQVDVVEPSPASVQEYQRRLVDVHGGVQHRQAIALPDGRCFRFHAKEVFDLDPAVARRGCDLAVLFFSLSQIVADDTDLDALLGGLFVSRQIRNVIIAVHDHLVDPQLPHRDGVVCTMLRSSGCSVHPLVCRCPGGNGRAGRLRITVLGSTMANGIDEFAFSVEHFLERLRVFESRHPELGRIDVHQWMPWGPGEAHWLLRSLAFLWITVA